MTTVEPLVHKVTVLQISEILTDHRNINGSSACHLIIPGVGARCNLNFALVSPYSQVSATLRPTHGTNSVVRPQIAELGDLRSDKTLFSISTIPGLGNEISQG